MDLAATLVAVITTGLTAFLLAGPWPPKDRADDESLTTGGFLLDPRYIFGTTALFFQVISFQGRLVEPWLGHLLVTLLVPTVLGVTTRRALDRRRPAAEGPS